MSSSRKTNHCQNLWAQFNKAEAARRDCSISLDSTNRDGAKDSSDLASKISAFESEIHRLEQTWRDSFVEHDGMLIFGPDYDVLKKLGDLLPSGTMTPLEIFQSGNLNSDGRVRTLFLTGKEIADTAEACELMRRLTELERLDVCRSGISDLAFTSSLTKIRELGADDVADLAPIAKLKALQDLTISFAGKVDVAPLANCRELESLELKNLADSDVDFSPLADRFLPLEGLEINGDFNNSQLSDLLRSSGIVELTLWGIKKPENLEPLVGNETLIEISISSSYPSQGALDLGPLATMPNLSFIRIDSSSVTNLEALLNVPADCGIDLFDLDRADFDDETLKALEARGAKIEWMWN